MEKNNFFSDYSKNGYFITNPLLTHKDIFNIREDLDKELKLHKEEKRIGIEKIQNQDLLKKIIKIFASNEIRHITEKAEIFLKKKSLNTSYVWNSQK